MGGRNSEEMRVRGKSIATAVEMKAGSAGGSIRHDDCVSALAVAQCCIQLHVRAQLQSACVCSALSCCT